MKRKVAAGAFALVLATVPGVALGVVVYSEDFDVDPSANWMINHHPSTDDATDFFFDYSSVGIPPAPNSTGGTTRGMKLQANLSSGIFGGYSVSPIGQSFTGTNMTLSFDLWSNFNGPFPGGGSGSTNLSTYGILTSGTASNYPGVVDGVWFANTGDGGSSADWRAYTPAHAASYGDTDLSGGNPVYAAGAVAGSRNNTNAYYSGLGGVAAPAAQLALFPQQTGNTNVGSGGMAWHEVVIDKVGPIVTYTIDGLLIATVDITGEALGGGNILFGHSDINASSSTDPNDVNLLFTLIDNVSVVPEPASLALLGLGAVAMLRRRR